MSSTNPYAAKASVAKTVAAEAPKEENLLEVPHGTISEVLAWVNDDQERAQAALDAEQDGAKRVTLISALEDIVNK